jgi:hypothetical protein
LCGSEHLAQQRRGGDERKRAGKWITATYNKAERHMSFAEQVT